jgi:hypothetical protein
MMPAAKDRAARRLSVALRALALGAVRASLTALPGQATLPAALETVLQDGAWWPTHQGPRPQRSVPGDVRGADAVKAKLETRRPIT